MTQLSLKVCVRHLNWLYILSLRQQLKAHLLLLFPTCMTCFPLWNKRIVLQIVQSTFYIFSYWTLGLPSPQNDQKPHKSTIRQCALCPQFLIFHAEIVILWVRSDMKKIKQKFDIVIRDIKSGIGFLSFPVPVPERPWTFGNISSFVFLRSKQALWTWNDVRVSKWWIFGRGNTSAFTQTHLPWYSSLPSWPKPKPFIKMSMTFIIFVW